MSYLLATILQKATQMPALDFAHRHLFTPLGITDVTWPASPQGINRGWGDMWLSPHAMAKIGWLYLQKGRWEHQQIVSEAWVEAATRRHISGTLFAGYGYQWWIDPRGYYMAVGYRGQFIFVVPDKRLVAVFTSHLERGEFYIPRDLLTQRILPAIVSSEPLEEHPAHQARLAAFVERVAKAPEQGLIWTSVAEGVAKNSEFVRTASPAFRFAYPKGSRKALLTGSSQIMTMRSPQGARFTAAVRDIPRDATLATVGPTHYVSRLQKVGSAVHVMSNTAITLQDGTRAYRTEIAWLWQESLTLTTQLISVFHDSKWVTLATRRWQGLPDAAPVVERLTFK